MKTNHPETTRRADDLPKSEAVETTKEVEGAHRKAVLAQCGNDTGEILVKEGDKQ